jgi:hypothetical protein
MEEELLSQKMPRRLLFLGWFEGDEGGTPGAGGFVAEAEGDDVRGATEAGVDEFAEGAGAFAVDDADFAPGAGAGFFEEGIEDLAGVGGAKGV